MVDLMFGHNYSAGLFLIHFSPLDFSCLEFSCFNLCFKIKDTVSLPIYIQRLFCLKEGGNYELDL